MSPVEQIQNIDATARLAAIVESSDDAIVSKSLAGIIQSWNRGAERLFGFTAQEAIGQPMTIVFPPDRLQEEPAILRRIQEGERVDHFETVRRHKSGKLIDISVTISPMRDLSGKIVGASKIARDISQQKEAERQLLLANELAEKARKAAESANEAKDRFLSVLSHELRTPLTPVLAAVSLIQASASLNEDELRRHLSMIRRNIETEARLVDDLLDITRISRGKIELQLESVDAHAAVRNVVAMLQNEIDAKQLEVSIALRAKNRQVWADAGRLQQILLNLISNAIKFTPASGKIAISAEGGGDQVTIEIVDNGIGIDPAIMPRLFLPFEQGEQTITRRFGGLGLGLSIARALVELHGGTIVVSSGGLGTGATFSISLRTALPAAERPSNIDTPCQETGARRSRVLLVEDHDDTRNLLAILLSSVGCDVTSADSVATAVAAAKLGRFDLLVSDIGLPDGTGIDVIVGVRAEQPIRAIALSGFGQEHDLLRSRDAGFERHLVKPVSMETLAEAVKQLCA